MAGWELFSCVYSCKYVELWYLELMIASNIQISAAAGFWILSLGTIEVMVASKIQKSAAAGFLILLLKKHG